MLETILILFMRNGLLLLDIDDTMVKTNADMIGVWKRYPNGTEKRLSTAEYAVDLDAKDGGKSANVVFDYREFGMRDKVTQSIINGTPLVKNLRILDWAVEHDYDVGFLTARSAEDMIYEVLSDWLKHKSGNNFEPVKLKRDVCFAINDPKYMDENGNCTLGNTDPEKKTHILKYVASEYKLVKFVDDDRKNIANARALRIPNLRVITAWRESVLQEDGFKLYHVVKDERAAQFVRSNGIKVDDQGIVYLTTNPDKVYKKDWYPNRVVFEVDIPEESPRLMDWRDVWEDNGDDKEYDEGYYCYFDDIPLRKIREIF